MRAIVFNRYGGPEVLSLVEMPDPVAGPGQILMRVMAAAVNPADYKWRSGMFAQMMPLQLPHIVGYDVSGTVIAVGTGVEEILIGDRVAALLSPITKGGYAEIVAVDAVNVAKIPMELDFAHAAAVPCAMLTGVQGVDEILLTKPGQTLLVTGATGAVGLVAMLTAIRRGTRVVAAVREKYAVEALARGAIATVTLGAEDWTGDPFDHVFDTVGGGDVAKLCHQLEAGGKILTVATTPIDPDGLIPKPQFYGVHPDGPRLGSLLNDVASGRIPVTIEHRLPLEQAAEGQRLVEKGGLTGKVILEP